MKKTVYNIVRLEVIYIQKYNLEAKNKDEMEDKMIWISEWFGYQEPNDTFEFKDQIINWKLNFEISRMYDDDIEDWQKMFENVLEFIEE